MEQNAAKAIRLRYEWKLGACGSNVDVTHHYRTHDPTYIPEDMSGEMDRPDSGKMTPDSFQSCIAG